ncbi:MAG: hypothetical protein IT378_15690 [Sandaracinaceae bacterium]|nr:hypothetical protein [Sandaracinaceae bacterium]
MPQGSWPAQRQRAGVGPERPCGKCGCGRGGLRRDWPTGEWWAEVAEQALTAWEQSGLSETAFCRTTGISRGRIRGWKRKLRPGSA